MQRENRILRSELDSCARIESEAEFPKSNSSIFRFNPFQRMEEIFLRDKSW